MVDSEFWVLKFLADGPKTIAQFRERPDWAERSAIYLLQVLRRLENHGYVTIDESQVPRVRADGRNVSHWANLNELTEAGRAELEAERRYRDGVANGEELPQLTRNRRRIAPKLPPAMPDERPDDDEKERVLRWAEEHHPDFGLVCGALWEPDGLYFGEILSLDWAHVDFDRGTIRVAGNRAGEAVRISDGLRAILERARNPHPDKLLFTNAAGTRHRRTSFTNEFLNVKRRAGIGAYGGLLHGPRPSKDLLRKVLNAARADSRPFIRALACRLFRFDEIAGLRVRDINLNAGTVTVAGLPRSVPEEFLNIVRTAVAPRKSGPVFRDSQGHPRKDGDRGPYRWQRSQFHAVFRRARRELGLGPAVQPMGRGNMWSVKRRLKIESEKELVRAAVRQRKPLLQTNLERKSQADRGRENCRAKALEMLTRFPNLSIRQISEKLETEELSSETIRQYLRGLKSRPGAR
jgi:integrase